MDTGAISAVVDAIRQAMKLNPVVFVSVAQSPNGLYLALTVVALAGLSETVGQSLILFVNRLRPIRFVPALLIGVFSYVFGYVLWTTSVYVVVRYGFGVTAAWVTIAAVVGLAYAPQVLSFFELTPYFGNAFGILLTLWSMVAVVVAIVAGLELDARPGRVRLCPGLGAAPTRAAHHRHSRQQRLALVQNARHRQPPSLYAARPAATAASRESWFGQGKLSRSSSRDVEDKAS